jgi:hypothetical protein
MSTFLHVAAALSMIAAGAFLCIVIERRKSKTADLLDYGAVAFFFALFLLFTGATQ